MSWTMIDRDTQFAYDRWLGIQSRRASIPAVAGTDAADAPSNDFEWGTVPVSLCDRTYLEWSIASRRSTTP